MKLWLLTALLLAALAAAFDAGAHAVLLSTQPADGAVLREPPARVTFSFNEPVQLIDGRVLQFYRSLLLPWRARSWTTYKSTNLMLQTQQFKMSKLLHSFKLLDK